MQTSVPCNQTRLAFLVDVPMCRCAFASGSLLSFSLGHPQWWSCRGGGALGRGTSMTVWHTVGVSIPSNWFTTCTPREDRKHFHKTCFPTHFASKSCQNQFIIIIIFFRSWDGALVFGRFPHQDWEPLLY